MITDSIIKLLQDLYKFMYNNEGVKPERSLLLILRIELLIGKNLYI